MKKVLYVLTWAFLFCLNACFSIAQTEQDSTIYRVETNDGNEYIGTILYQDTEKLRLKTQNLGEVTILKADIVRESPVNVSRVEDGKYWFENPQAARYFWAPNGYGLQKGEAYYQNVWVMFNQASVGVTDNFSIGAGLIPLFLFAGTATPVWVTPKFSVPVTKDKLNLRGGALSKKLVLISVSLYRWAARQTAFLPSPGWALSSPSAIQKQVPPTNQLIQSKGLSNCPQKTILFIQF